MNSAALNHSEGGRREQQETALSCKTLKQRDCVEPTGSVRNSGGKVKKLIIKVSQQSDPTHILAVIQPTEKLTKDIFMEFWCFL